MSWHNHDVERLLCLSGSGIIIDYQIPQNLPMTFNNMDDLWTTEYLNLKSFNDHSNKQLDDTQNISEDMKEKALKGYGLLRNIQQNGELGNNTLKQVWRQLALMDKHGCMQGLKSLGSSNNIDRFLPSKSEINYIEWRDYPSIPPLKVYKSEQRTLCQVICGWDFERDSDSSFNNYIEQICAKNEITRATLIAVFHQKLKLAVDILSKSNDATLQMAAIALNIEKMPVASSEVSHLFSQLSDPFLKCMFAFVYENDEKFDKILNEPYFTLCDRVGFACLYLTDAQLGDYLKKQSAKCIENGDLSGIFLTGINSDGVSLLQSYLDLTEDVQTVAVIASRFLTNEQFSNFKIQYWIATYRNLLDRWGLFQQRANFDIMMGSKNMHKKNVFLLCNFCGKNMSTAFQEEARIKTINRCTACPHCRKPLPRCSLCLQHMGTLNSDSVKKTIRKDVNNYPIRSFSSWFAFCLKCKHSGHTIHLNNWFSQYSECPVVGCNCRCYEDTTS